MTKAESYLNRRGCLISFRWAHSYTGALLAVWDWTDTTSRPGGASHRPTDASTSSIPTRNPIAVTSDLRLAVAPRCNCACCKAHAEFEMLQRCTSTAKYKCFCTHADTDNELEICGHMQGDIVWIIKRRFGFETGFIRFDYNHNIVTCLVECRRC
jgi:hypothetical protein